MIKKGIVLAGGSGTRLFPLTRIVSKQLMPVYNKPMIYYPLSTLMLTGIRDILVITLPQEQSLFQKVLQDGSPFGVNIKYAIQPKPEGIAQSLLIGQDFLSGEGCALVLGDNIHLGPKLAEKLRLAASRSEGATVFGYRVADPQRYGVAEFNESGQVIGIEEKPTNPKSNYAVTGLYFYDHKAANYAAKIKPSWRGELEITDINRCYLEQGQLYLERLGPGYTWLDTGTHDSLLDAAKYIQMLEVRQGIQVGSPEYIAYQQGWLSKEELLQNMATAKNSGYFQLLQQMVLGGELD